MIDTPEAAENFTRFIEEGKVLETDDEPIVLADPKILRELAEKNGYREP